MTEMRGFRTPATSILPESLSTLTSGKTRRVGFEIEFGGLTFDRCLETVSAVIDGEVKRVSPIEAVVTHDEFGDFELELDWQFLKDQAKDDFFQSDVIKLIGDIAGSVVPLEIVFPPIDVDRISDTDDIVEALRLAGASGTDKSPLYAFGVHINTEIPDLEAATVSRYLKAYSLLQPWLVRAHSIDGSRRISPYVDLYKKDYIDLVLGYDTPSIENVMDDYLRHNPTRNRALDMLPMLSEIDSKRVQRVVNDDRVKARPTFHYRMPNCDIGRRDWTLISEWNRWCFVELMANEDLETMASEYHRCRKADLLPNDASWLAFLDQWAADALKNIA